MRTPRYAIPEVQFAICDFSQIVQYLTHGSYPKGTKKDLKRRIGKSHRPICRMRWIKHFSHEKLVKGWFFMTEAFYSLREKNASVMKTWKIFVVWANFSRQNNGEAIFSQMVIVNKSPGGNFFILGVHEKIAPLLGAIFSRGPKSHVTPVVYENPLAKAFRSKTQTLFLQYYLDHPPPQNLTFTVIQSDWLLKCVESTSPRGAAFINYKISNLFTAE